MDALKLKRCDLSKCEAMCCHDGVWLTEQDLLKIREAQALDQHSTLIPKDEAIIMQEWTSGLLYPKTAVREFTYSTSEWPSHFPRTRCVFADDQGLCKLETFARIRNENPWKYKPQACWLHPLTERDGKLVPPPSSPEEDPYSQGPSYPGFSTHTACGRHQEDGEEWSVVLFDELNEYSLNKKKLNC